VLVPESGAATAYAILQGTELAPAPAASHFPRPNPLTLVVAILGGGGLTALAAWLLQGGG
jgi:hypothetical protein